MILLTKELILSMRDNRTHTKLTQKIHLHFLIGCFYNMPFTRHIEKKKIGAVIQKIVKAIGLIESYSGIYRMIVELPLHVDVLIRYDILGMIEIDLEPPSFVFIQQETQPVIILGNGD